MIKFYFIYLFLLLQPDVASGSRNKESGTDSLIIKLGKLAGLLLLPLIRSIYEWKCAASQWLSFRIGSSVTG